MNLDWVWDSAYQWLVAHFLISGWYELLFWGVIVSFAAVLVSYFFTPLKPFAGAVVMSVAAALWAYWRGEKDARARMPKAKPPAPQDPWGWR